MSKYAYKIHLAQMTKGGAVKYPYWSSEVYEAKFSKSYASCTVAGMTLKKVKGGGPSGSNYSDVVTGDYYRISKY